MKRYIKDSESIFGMSNVRGRHIKVEKGIPFLFYYSPKDEDRQSHEIRVKPSFNREKLMLSQAGTLKLCDDWKYIPGEKDQNISAKQITAMKQFFRKYLVLFCAVWDKQVYDTDLEDFMRGEISLAEFIQDLDFYDKYKDDLDQIKTVSELEDYCYKNNLINLRDNR